MTSSAHRSAQDAHVFDTTLFENVRLARPEASPGEVWTALERAGLGGWVEGLPAGWDTPVGDRGDRLSEGQRRRPSVARARLARFLIVILDEPTVNLDGATARRLRPDILTATARTTLLVITHDRRWLDEVDGVAVPLAGCIASLPARTIAAAADSGKHAAATDAVVCRCCGRASPVPPRVGLSPLIDNVLPADGDCRANRCPMQQFRSRGHRDVPVGD